MITPHEADGLAKRMVTEYINTCECDTEQDVANVLMKLSSMCGMTMCAVVGHEEAFARMDGTAKYIKAAGANIVWKKARVQ
jgi:hypothetical protein